MKDKDKVNWEKLEQELKRFDYTYMMSDDHRIWLAGTKTEEELRKFINIAREKDKERTNKLIKKYKSRYGTQF